MAGYRGPSIDHGILSPSGRCSKRARAAAIARDQARVAAWFEKHYPHVEATPEAVAAAESARLMAHAARLRELAARGMSPRKFMREAAKAEAQAADIAARGSHE